MILIYKYTKFVTGFDVSCLIVSWTYRYRYNHLDQLDMGKNKGGHGKKRSELSSEKLEAERARREKEEQ